MLICARGAVLIVFECYVDVDVEVCLESGRRYVNFKIVFAEYFGFIWLLR
jgi:hypothetical protein